MIDDVLKYSKDDIEEALRFVSSIDDIDPRVVDIMAWCFLTRFGRKKTVIIPVKEGMSGKELRALAFRGMVNATISVSSGYSEQCPQLADFSERVISDSLEYQKHHEKVMQPLPGSSELILALCTIGHVSLFTQSHIRQEPPSGDKKKKSPAQIARDELCRNKRKFRY